MSMPTSRMASTATGLIWSAGSEPAERTSTASPARWRNQPGPSGSAGPPRCGTRSRLPRVREGHPERRHRPDMKLNKRGYEHARRLVEEGRFVADDRDLWSEHQPSSQRENEFLAAQGLGEYGRWHLGVDEAVPEDRKGRYRFPYGDFADVHRCGVLSAEVRAAQYKHHDIELAAAHLHGMIDGG